MTSAEYFISLITVASAKKLATALVLCFILYHGLMHLIYGSDSCKWLLTEGRYKGDKEWQPYGCMMHYYTQTDSRRCLRYLAFMGHRNHFAFIGDARIRQLYKSFISQFVIDGKASDLTELPENSDLNFNDAQLRLNVQFLWRSQLDNSMIEDLRNWIKTDAPSLIISGCGAKTILANNNSDAQLYSEYSMGLVRLVQPVDFLVKKNTKYLWMLQDPVLKERLPAQLSGIGNRQINLCNKAAIKILSHSEAHIWESSKLVGAGVLEQSPDGYLASPLSLRHKIQILLNTYCNDHMNFDDGSCCSYPEPATTLQLLSLSALALCVVIGGGMWLYRKFCHRTEISYSRLTTVEVKNTEEANNSEIRQIEQSEVQDFYTLMTSLALLSIILYYFYLCDRTNFFMKENKYYSEFSFWLPLGYILALGLFFTEDRERGPRTLNREQTDEWRGLMQAVVLIYHVTGAKNVLPIYMYLRLINSAYLFLSGYGHFCYFWQTGDVSLVRFARVMFRLNFLTVSLCLCMNRPYQFYHFVPLVSFWFLVIYFLAWLPPRIYSGNLNEYGPRALLYLALKLLGLVSMITILYMSEVFFEKVFVTRPWKALFVTTDDDIREWWSRWRVDRYSIAWGVTFGAGLVALQRIDHIPGTALSSLLALISLTAYTTFTILCHSVSECEEIHSYVAFIPIIGYIALRNASLALRGKHSALLTGLGRISLETLVAQGHIWLAADSHGVLVLLPRFPVLNLLVTSFIFICASHEIHRLTQVLAPYAVPNDWRLVARNLLLFIAVLVPIGIHDGMF
ncbi:N-acetylneuraminate 9-O-acetyltransferase [Frieseomelitta varia]|uniref:N-acetylneuraminate 9-O-acetyltransferase n=1 Tax=Frieseomelitta varia TaxID=561572 RepID=UPI001CB6ABA8|nr:N-acetylneuraminate 9-O-acetyltransferase [Frieseomelitta varia]XP_043525408.1 N-acetylneuraminate 9-O-acetyltransferase [Frieseomelitta varia]XP_043525409.1 N-acetylneuraminate 9-O-acetyltransferase [Frieseomelitta varia]XP_043525410.1 N-acetylneuraminate 9-O-acetyltransferase [Frieseomelitta varia]